MNRTNALRTAAAVVLAIAGIVNADDYKWPVDRRPSLPFRTAIDKAEAAKPAGAFCRYVNIFLDRDGEIAVWNFSYDVSADRAALVSVTMGGATRATEHAQFLQPPDPTTTQPTTRPARRAKGRKDADWPVGVPPPISLSDAFGKAFAQVGDPAQLRFCIGASLRATPAQDGKAGTWKFFWYGAERRKSFTVVVDMEGRVRVEG